MDGNSIRTTYMEPMKDIEGLVNPFFILIQLKFMSSSLKFRPYLKMFKSS